MKQLCAIAVLFCLGQSVEAQNKYYVTINIMDEKIVFSIEKDTKFSFSDGSSRIVATTKIFEIKKSEKLDRIQIVPIEIEGEDIVIDSHFQGQLIRVNLDPNRYIATFAIPKKK